MRPAHDDVDDVHVLSDVSECMSPSKYPCASQQCTHWWPWLGIHVDLEDLVSDATSC